MFKKVFICGKLNRFFQLKLIKRCCSQKVHPRRIFSGIQPTGTIHLGNYLGAVDNWVKYQNEGEDVIWSIVDMHSITQFQNPQLIRESILNVAATLLACGIDPDKSILFQQSTVPMHAELCWVLACLTTMQRLTHQPQFKEKSEKLKDIPLGLYIYPVLQAADILLYKATHVPVGQDQVQHIQLSNHLAQKFNVIFGDTFPRPVPLINDSAKIQSLRYPLQKMSKSCPNSKSRVELTDEPDVILMKVKKAVTDCTSEVTYEPTERPGVSNLIRIHSLVSGKTPEDICNECRGIDTGKYKLVVADILIQKINPIRERIKELLKEPQYLKQVLREGGEKAENIAMKNWLEVREKVGFGNGTLSIDTKETLLSIQ